MTYFPSLSYFSCFYHAERCFCCNLIVICSFIQAYIWSTQTTQQIDCNLFSHPSSSLLLLDFNMTILVHHVFLTTKWNTEYVALGVYRSSKSFLSFSFIINCWVVSRNKSTSFLLSQYLSVGSSFFWSPPITSNYDIIYNRRISMIRTALNKNYNALNIH